MTTPCIIFDIDGTLANITHRLHHVRLMAGSKAFFGEVEVLLKETVSLKHNAPPLAY